MIVSGGYEKAKLDSWVEGNLPVAARHADPAYMFMRGREQTIIDKLGGAKSTAKQNWGKSRSGNTINGIDLTPSNIGKKEDTSPSARRKWREGCLFFAKLHPIQPDINWDGAVIWCW